MLPAARLPPFHAQAFGQNGLHPGAVHVGEPDIPALLVVHSPDDVGMEVGFPLSGCRVSLVPVDVDLQRHQPELLLAPGAELLQV